MRSILTQPTHPWKSLKRLVVLGSLISFLISGCEEPTNTFSAMDREVHKTSISSADLIDQITLSTGNGSHETGPIIIFDPELFRCKDGAADTDLELGLLVEVTNTGNDDLFIVDSFYSARALIAKTEAGAKYYSKFKLKSRDVLQIMEGPFCYGKVIWWLTVMRDHTSPNTNAYLFGFVPETRDGTKLLEPWDGEP